MKERKPLFFELALRDKSKTVLGAGSYKMSNATNSTQCVHPLFTQLHLSQGEEDMLEAVFGEHRQQT